MVFFDCFEDVRDFPPSGKSGKEAKIRPAMKLAHRGRLNIQGQQTGGNKVCYLNT